jgi:DNA helicase-2/ATP-dependent DNA helicase PcrA
MGVEVEHQFFAVAEDEIGGRHGGKRSPGPRPRAGTGARPGAPGALSQALIRVGRVEPERVLDGLNEQQRAAVTTSTTPLCILAGAGSGKTRVLTRRIAHRALTGEHDPRHVLALTFTRKAAGELSSRLRRLGLRDSVAAGTFHAVAYAQLRARWADRGIRPPDLLDRKVGFVARLLPRSAGPAGRAGVLDVVTEIEWAKARALRPDDYFAEAQRLHRRAPLPQKEMAAVFERYEDEKRNKRLVDFDDLLRLCRRDLLEDKEFAQAQRWRFQHVFVDEFQDVNPLQRSLLEAWVGGRDDLCVVGDPNQAIYAWNGADPTALTGFLDRYPAGEVIRLTENYRSSPEILAVANAVLAGGALEGEGSTADAADAALGANRPSGPLPTIHAHADDATEARAIARAVRDHHRPGARWSAQAVLCRTNAQAALIEQALHRAGIPFRVRGGGNLLDQPEVQTALRDIQRHQGEFAVAITDLETTAARLAGGTGTGTGTGDGPPDESDDDDQHADDRSGNLTALARMARDFAAVDTRPTGAGFVAWLTATTRADQPDGRGDAVEIATFHAAKGLEWSIVHLAGVEQGLVPIGRAKTPDALAEERRLFYVAVTRAEQQLHCTWAESRTFGDRSAERTRSPYLDEVEAACRALSDGQAPVDWTVYLAAQRATLPTPSTGPGAARSDSGRGRGLRRTPLASELDDAALITFDALKAWRARQARAAAVPPFAIFQDRVLVDVAANRPTTRDELLAVAGIGQVKVQRFGDAILGIVADHEAS